MTDIKFTEGIVLIETITGKAFSEPQLNAYRTLLNDMICTLSSAQLNY